VEGLKRASLGAGQGGVGKPEDGSVLCRDFSMSGECSAPFVRCAELPLGQSYLIHRGCTPDGKYQGPIQISTVCTSPYILAF
jgi:hypothetical protein